MIEYPVTLEWFECALGAEAGKLRHLSSIKAGRKPNHGYEGDCWSEHIEGACGELALAKLLGVYWNGSVNTFSQDDLPGVGVRTRSEHYYDLLVRPGDSNTAHWVLVTGRCPHYVVRGWMLGSEAKTFKMEDYGKRKKPAHFVPQSKLNPDMEVIRDLILTNYQSTRAIHS